MEEKPGGNEDIKVDCEGANGNEGTKVEEDTDEIEGANGNEGTKVDCEVAKVDCLLPKLPTDADLGIAAPSFSGRMRLGANTDLSGNTKECRGGMHST